MPLINITPFRQIARIYGAMLAAERSLHNLSENQRELIKFQIENCKSEKYIQVETSKPDPKPIDIYERLNLTLLLDKSSLVDKSLIDHGHWEPDQTSFFFGTMANFLGERKTAFLDVGSYWGLYSLLARRAGINKIFAFEPDRYNFSQLQSQLFLNNATGDIKAINKAISDKSQVVNFWDSRTHPSGNRAGSAVVGSDFHRPTYEVSATSLDEMFDFIDHFIWIKLDVEGHEANALRGMKNLVSNNQVLIQVEVFDINKESIIRELDGLGLRKVHEIYPDQYYTNMSDGRIQF
ncbi:FkbM family methyltransferase [Burkholderia metallica]|uniref:FkbM family methyltransferase n=1 Tax=Burkholderia metallica TaxID=488729 RepID=UPI00157B51FB|nr:FkbM family methyltransferase [Burkholderia metallica]NTZ82187.1 FkbM family methyltransferase [Burkholderia metallica]